MIDNCRQRIPCCKLLVTFQQAKFKRTNQTYWPSKIANPLNIRNKHFWQKWQKYKQLINGLKIVKLNECNKNFGRSI